jgi:hypothetical protein
MREAWLLWADLEILPHIRLSPVSYDVNRGVDVPKRCSSDINHGCDINTIYIIIII